MSYPMLWLILLVAFALLEGLTAALVSVWFCAGSLAAFFVSVADIGIGVQIGVFAGISLLSMVIIRPIVKKYWQPKLQKTNVDSVLGKEGLVTETIDNISGTGQAKIGGIIWTARSEDGNPIGKNSLVTVNRVEGVKVMVSLAEKGGETLV